MYAVSDLDRLLKLFTFGVENMGQGGLVERNGFQQTAEGGAAVLAFAAVSAVTFSAAITGRGAAVFTFTAAFASAAVIAAGALTTAITFRLAFMFALTFMAAFMFTLWGHLQGVISQTSILHLGTHMVWSGLAARIDRIIAFLSGSGQVWKAISITRQAAGRLADVTSRPWNVKNWITWFPPLSQTVA